MTTHRSAVCDLKSKTASVTQEERPGEQPGERRWEACADLVVVGTGIAGLTAALRARELGLRTLVVTKAALTDSNTRWAQGGLAVVFDEHSEHLRGSDTGSGRAGDTVGRHVADTVSAAAGLCDPAAARSIIAGGAGAVARLRARGAVFDRCSAPGEGLARTREGGHSALRVIHAGGDATGAEIQRALADNATRDRVPILEQHIAVDALLTPHGAVGGVHVLDDRGVAGVVRAPAVLVATGGFGQLYHATSNPEIATGDGLALALRAGAPAADLEFVQFHPTVLYTPGARGRCPLVTEAVRGEGAVLVDGAGAPVMNGVHPLADLAPRDVVSAAITCRMAQAPGGVDDHVFLDASAIADFGQRFPTVTASCAQAGIDPERDAIPVTPAAHFACGGVLSTSEGRTEVPGLYAAGEVARTGLHGANRLASNSLLEGLVVGERAAEAVAADRARGALGTSGHVEYPSTSAQQCADRESVQRAMSRHAAIGRDTMGLSALVRRITSSTTTRWMDSHEAVEDAAMTVLARALVLAAASRTESRGAHVRTDFPERDDRWWQRGQRVRLDADGDPVLDEQRAVKGAA